MIELKLSQGAKPGYGGVLPGVKVSPEIAATRGILAGETIVSPPGYSTFSTPLELLEFIAKLRDLAAGKPVGFKLCIGRRSDFSRSARPCGRRKSCPTLSLSMVVKAAPAQRPWNSPIQ
jgi:glutamate synthase domain-containing protein 2